MTKAERTLVLDWSDKICKEQKHMEDLSRELREMSERRGYGSLPCSPEESLRYLFTIDDQHIHNSALSIYSCYRELTGRYEAMLELTQGFADLSGKSF